MTHFKRIILCCGYQEIEEAETDEHYRPKMPLGIIEVTLKQKV